ncbi:solute carrier family 66 member 2-like isoform X2 [Amphiura filiformis]|uniref:solute carrier family 66 member 2-like isoform X2 n=1 Tax=Amphiura filiformis TaxID=82378 RepID=UPI003B2219F3
MLCVVENIEDSKMARDIIDGILKFQFVNPQITFGNLVSWIASGAMIFGGIVPYIPQYLEIKRTDNADGFSTYVCLALLVANTLRILFWFGHPFELPLLLQSIIMIATMMAMLQLCTRVNILHDISTKKKRFVDFDRKHFWQWSHFVDYCFFMGTFSLVCGFITFLFSGNSIYVEALGFMAVFTEAMLGVPQFYRNYQNKSTHGMSVKMVLCWLSGDTFKTGYFMVNKAPVQFWVCGMLQISIDIAILLQVCYYGDKPYKKIQRAVPTTPTAEHIS